MRKSIYLNNSIRRLLPRPNSNIIGHWSLATGYWSWVICHVIGASVRPTVRPTIPASDCPSARAFVRPYDRSPVRPFDRPCDRPSVRPTIRPSDCPSVRAFVRPSDRPSAKYYHIIYNGWEINKPLVLQGYDSSVRQLLSPSPYYLAQLASLVARLYLIPLGLS